MRNRQPWATACLIALVLAAAEPAGAQDRPPATLRVLSYNVHLLPDIAYTVAGHRGKAEYRAAALVERLAGYDLLGLCEVFDDDRREELIEGIDEAAGSALYNYWEKKPPGRARTNSGLLLLSRSPIEDRHALTYQHASRFVAYGLGADGFAAKGALHARIRIHEDPPLLVDCFLTHLESRSSTARQLQIGELREFIAQHTDRNRPMIVLGDMNVAADDPRQRPAGPERTPYQRLRLALDHHGLSLVDVWAHLGNGPGGTSDALAEDGGRRIDYIFVSRRRPGAWSLAPARVSVLPMLDEQVPEGSLSDHAAVECVLEVRSKERG